MTDLTAHWRLTTFSEIGKWGSGGTPKSSEPTYYDGDVPWIRSGDLPDGPITDHTATITPEGLANCAAKWVPAGAVLIALYGATIGKLGITTYSVTTNQAVAYCVPDPALTSVEFLFYYLLNMRPALIALGQGGAQPNISQLILKSQPLMLPPLEEQRRIVAKIDSLSGRSSNARDELGHIPKLVARYRRAVLATAFRGGLTASRRTNRMPAAGAQNPSNDWKKHSLIELCDPKRGITYGVIKLGEEVTDGTPCLRTSNVRWLRLDTDGIKRISPALSSDYARTILRGGEVLVNVRGTLGGVAVVPPDMTGWNVSREVAVVPVDTSRFDSAYVAYWVSASASQRWLSRMEKGVAYTGVNLEDLRKLPIEVPSLDEQREIVRHVGEAFLRIRTFTGEVSRATNLLDLLDKAVLTKAFDGDLIAPREITVVQTTMAAE